MLAKWTEILPLFVIRWLAISRCERVWASGDLVVAMARPDVLIQVEKKEQQ